MGALSNVLEVKYASGKYSATVKAGGFVFGSDISTALTISGNTGAALNNAPAVGGAGLKIHTHSNTNNSGGTAPNDFTYINEFKGEFVSTSGTMVGVGADFTLSGTGTGSMCAMYGYAKLLTGITLSGSAYPAIGVLTGGQFFANVAGVLNGTEVLVTGLYAGINACTGGTLTVARYMSAIWADYKSVVELSTGDSNVLLLTNSGTADVDYGINIVCGSTGKITTAINMSSILVDDNAGDATASLFLAGKATTGGHTAPSAPITFATANQHGLQFYLKSTANKFTGMEMNAYTDAAMAGTQWANMCVAGEFTVRSLGGASVDNMWAGLFQAQILSTYYGPGTGKLMCAGLFKISAASASGGVAGISAGIYIDTGMAKASTQGDFGLFMISNNSAGIPLTSFLHFAGGSDYWADFDAVQTEPNGNCFATDGAQTNTAEAHNAGWLRIRMVKAGAAVDRYIQLLDPTL